MKQQYRYVSLDNVDALASCSELVPVNLKGCDKLRSKDGIANYPNLNYLYASYCKEGFNPKPRVKQMATREGVEAYQVRIRKAMQ